MIEKRLTVNGVEIQLHEYPHTGTPIVFLHFGSGNLMMWQRVVPFFQNEHHLILPDLRAHGRSSKLLPSVHFDDMAVDIAGVLEQLNVEKAHVIGSSMGAEVGLSLAANYPEKVLSLVCDGALASEFGPYGTFEGSEEEFDKYVTEQLDGIRNAPARIFGSPAAYVDSLRPVWEEMGFWNEFVEAFLLYNAYEIRPGEFMRCLQNADSEKYTRDYFYARFEEYYRRVKCPVLMLPGADAWKDEKESAAIKKMSTVPENGKLIVVPGWVHPYGWMVNPDEACRQVKDFFEQAEK